MGRTLINSAGNSQWQVRRYTKDPDTEKRVARPNNETEWVAGEVSSLRIIDNDLWNRVKRRQAEVLKEFEHTQSTNKLNTAHMPAYSNRCSAPTLPAVA